MNISTPKADLATAGASDVLIPLIRAAATIGFVIAPYSLGFVFIAMSEKLIRSIMVGEHPEMLVSELQTQFPNASIEAAETYDAGLVAKIVALLERSDQMLDLPLDIRGTDFQSRVWDALQNTPTGDTVNYTFLAEQISAPCAPQR